MREAAGNQEQGWSLPDPRQRDHPGSHVSVCLVSILSDVRCLTACVEHLYFKDEVFEVRYQLICQCHLQLSLVLEQLFKRTPRCRNMSRKCTPCQFYTFHFTATCQFKYQ